MMKEKDAKTHATVLAMLGDLPDADITPPDNVLFVCKVYFSYVYIHVYTKMKTIIIIVSMSFIFLTGYPTYKKYISFPTFTFSAFIYYSIFIVT
jgi:hypothetical protein